MYVFITQSFDGKWNDCFKMSRTEYEAPLTIIKNVKMKLVYPKLG